MISELNTAPALPPVNAWPEPSPAPTHDSVPRRLATPYRVEELPLQCSARFVLALLGVLCRRRGPGQQAGADRLGGAARRQGIRRQQGVPTEGNQAADGSGLRRNSKCMCGKQKRRPKENAGPIFAIHSSRMKRHGQPSLATSPFTGQALQARSTVRAAGAVCHPGAVLFKTHHQDAVYVSEYRSASALKSVHRRRQQRKRT